MYFHFHFIPKTIRRLAEEKITTEIHNLKTKSRNNVKFVVACKEINMLLSCKFRLFSCYHEKMTHVVLGGVKDPGVLKHENHGKTPACYASEMTLEKRGTSDKSFKKIPPHLNYARKKAPDFSKHRIILNFTLQNPFSTVE